MSQLQHKPQPFLPLGYTVEGNKLVTLDGFNFERHKHIIGISGSGKSSFIATLVLFLLRLGIACCVIDPTGDLAKLILSLLASSDFYSNPRAYDRLWYVDFNRQDGAAIAWNVLKQDHIDNYKVSNNILQSIHRAWPTASGTTTALDNTITYASFVLAENGMPITQLQRFLLDASFRDTLLAKITDQQIIQFFDFKFADKVSSQLIDSTMRRLDLLTFSPSLRRALSQKMNKLNMRSLMDNNISCLISLGGLSDEEQRLAGCLLMTSLEQSFLSRASMPPEKRTPYHVIVDEFPLFSASGDSFSVILEQVRKYAGTLYLAHQTTSQLSKAMAGSLQNAISILFKLGYEDSTWATGRFVRHEDVQEPGLLDKLLAREKKQGVFDQVNNSHQAKQVFENLQRGEAIVTINNQALHIRTHTIPSVKINQKKLAEIEDTYARRLLTPLSQIEREQTLSNMVVVSSDAVSLAKRRVPSSIKVDREPLHLLTGVLDNDILLALYHFHYLKLTQLCKLLDRESSINHVRSKLNKLVSDDLVETTTLARASAGKPPTVYFLTAKGIKRVADTMGVSAYLPASDPKHGYLEHSLACSDILIQSVLLPHVEPSITLYDLKHERTLKNIPCKLSDGAYLVPDGWVLIRHNNTEDIGIAFEIDCNTETAINKIRQKILNYVAFSSGIYQQVFGLESLTIAFCVTDGGDRRVKQLLTWAEQPLDTNKDAASLFLFGSVSPGTLDPKSLFLDATFRSPFDSTPHALVENP